MKAAFVFAVLTVLLLAGAWLQSGNTPRDLAPSYPTETQP